MIKPKKEYLSLQTKEEKQSLLANKFTDVLHILGLNLTDPNLMDTPERIAKMYMQELFRGLFEPLPDLTAFEPSEKNMGNHQMVLVQDIEMVSTCAHHFVPFIGKVSIAYIPAKVILGLSKFSRLVSWCAAKPTIQENLTNEIGTNLVTLLGTEDVMLVLKAKHLCMSIRGVKDHSSETTTSFVSGKFFEPAVRNEFFQLLKI